MKLFEIRYLLKITVAWFDVDYTSFINPQKDTTRFSIILTFVIESIKKKLNYFFYSISAVLCIGLPESQTTEAIATTLYNSG